MVSSTTPRLGPRCPPLLERTVISRSRISAASCSSSERESCRTCSGESMPSSMLAIVSVNLRFQPAPFVLSLHPREDWRTSAAFPPAASAYRTCPVLLFSHEVGLAFGPGPKRTSSSLCGPGVRPGRYTARWCPLIVRSPPLARLLESRAVRFSRRENITLSRPRESSNFRPSIRGWTERSANHPLDSSQSLPAVMGNTIARKRVITNYRRVSSDTHYLGVSFASRSSKRRCGDLSDNRRPCLERCLTEPTFTFTSRRGPMVAPC